MSPADNASALGPTRAGQNRALGWKVSLLASSRRRTSRVVRSTNETDSPHSAHWCHVFLKAKTSQEVCACERVFGS
ncbi:hypothetical protein MRX96_043730 [Rhipicephalus microplus]